MRILFCVNRDLYANLALNHILPHLSPEDECLILCSRMTPGKRSNIAALSFLRFYEQDLPNAYLFPRLEEASPLGQGPLKTFEQLSLQYDAPLHDVTSAHSPEVLEQVRRFQPDLLVSIRFGHIFKEPMLAIPRHGVINLHSGLLPEYRGILATFWSLLHGESHYGYTLHTVSDASIDTGAIIERRRFPVVPGISLFEHILSLYEPAAESIVSVIQMYRDGEAPVSLPQDETESRYYSLPTAEDMDRLIADGVPLIRMPAYTQHLRRFEGIVNQEALALTLPEAQHFGLPGWVSRA